QPALSGGDGDGPRLPLHGGTVPRARLPQPPRGAGGADPDGDGDGAAPSEPAARLAREHGAHDAPDAAHAAAGVPAPRPEAARARGEERPDGIARRLRREARAALQGLGRPAGPLPPAEAGAAGRVKRATP